MAIVQTKVKRKRDGVTIRGTLQRDTAVYPNADANFLSDVRANLFDITLTTGEIIPGLGALQGILKVLTEPKLLPNSNTDAFAVEVANYDAANGEMYLRFIMRPPTYDGRVWQVFTAGKFYTKAEAEARPWPVRWPLLFSFHMVNPNVPDQDKRAQPTPNDQMVVMYI